MSSRAGLAAAACGVLVGAAGSVGCGDEAAPREGGAARTSVVSDGLRFTAVRFREIDPGSDADDELYEGPSAGAGQELAAAFIEICNVSETARQTPEGFVLVTAGGALHEPIEPSPGQRYAYRSEELQPGECQPDDMTVARAGAGAVVLVFELPEREPRRRPVRLRIPGADVEGASVLRFPAYDRRQGSDLERGAGA